MAFWNKLFGSQNEKSEINAEEIAGRLFMYYKIVRSRSEELGSEVISIGNNTYEYDGVATCASQFLAVCARDDDGAGADVANSMGMNVDRIQDKYYYQFVVRTALSVREKNQVLALLADKIRKEFPNDYLQQDSEFLISGIELKDFIEEMATR